MRLLFLALAIAFAALGILFGALNPQTATLDFYYVRVPASLGAAVLVSAFVGALLGGLAVLLGVVMPLQSRLRRARREQARPPQTLPAVIEEHP